MAAASCTETIPGEWTLADLVGELGGIPLERIRANPPLGTATEEDVLRSKSRHNRICELIDGVLVDKPMGTYESLLAAVLIEILAPYVREKDLGLVLGEGGQLKLLPRQVRVPDVSFIVWDRLPERKLPEQPIWQIVPDLAVEILSETNTEGEMERKLRDYFTAGVRLVWYIDPPSRTAKQYTSPDQCVLIDEQGTLVGGDVLPDFELPLAELFARAAGRGSK
ncbi:MAG: Uma2 family endonuclease [Pirellulaceae bacterium]